MSSIQILSVTFMDQIAITEGRFRASHEPSRAQEEAAFVRRKLAAIAAVIVEAQRASIGFAQGPDCGLGELKDALFVLQQLDGVLDQWPEYWDEQYMAEMAEED